MIGSELPFALSLNVLSPLNFRNGLSFSSVTAVIQLQCGHRRSRSSAVAKRDTTLFEAIGVIMSGRGRHEG